MSNGTTSSSGNSHARAARPPVADIPDPGAAISNPPTLKPPIASGLPSSVASSVTLPANFDPSSSREALIATAAYYRAEKRGFAPGHETEDWLAAEREVDAFGADLAL
jgi:hypothetical protein